MQNKPLDKSTFFTKQQQSCTPIVPDETLEQWLKEGLLKEQPPMTKKETLVNRVIKLVGYDDSYARGAIREIAKWLDEEGFPSECARKLEEEADNYQKRLEK